jgi:hypothetical protein
MGSCNILRMSPAVRDKLLDRAFNHLEARARQAQSAS